jgi:hypothetical protein
MPGSRYVTLGGALGNNIHGKNCEQEGNTCDPDKPSAMPYFSSSYQPDKFYKGEKCDINLLEAFSDAELSQSYE